MGVYKIVSSRPFPGLNINPATTLLRPSKTSQIIYTSLYPTTNTPTRKMAYLFPRVAFTPVRCRPARHEFASIFSLFDDAAREFRQVERVARQTRRPFNPRFDVKENKESYVLEGEVPGFSEGELSIEWKDNVLAIRGHTESVTESGKQPEAVEAATEKPAVQDIPASETSSVKSHQATVEDEEPTTSTTAPATENDQEVAKKAEAETPAQAESSKPEFQQWISERSTGEFLRQFSFPNNAVNHEAIKASLQSGILRIVVPKAPTPASRHISIE